MLTFSHVRAFLLEKKNQKTFKIIKSKMFHQGLWYLLFSFVRMRDLQNDNDIVHLDTHVFYHYYYVEYIISSLVFVVFVATFVITIHKSWKK